ncbi:4'-phosphopantetheinyl transferase family protein [Cellulomonas soli]|uniref:4'-phosphopantetheinyl transferase family protein n=1 Tax=Cellulomonas soli TaxID=931535 RepID=UPI003F85E61F
MQAGVAGPRVDVWATAARDVDVNRLVPVLDAAELARAEAMRPARRSSFVQARALLRGALGARLGLPPDQVGLRAACPECGRPHGPVVVQPRPDRGEAPWQVSLTRSGPLLVVAITATGPVGVDTESHAQVARAPLAEVALSEPERQAFERLPDDRRAAALTRAWVRKEATLKAWGTGLRVAPDLVDVRRDDVRLARGDARPAMTAWVSDLEVGPGVGAAVAVRTNPGSGPWPAPQVELHDGAAVLERVAVG